MPRFRNRTTGVLVNVDETLAAKLDPKSWEPADRPQAVKPAPRRRGRPPTKRGDSGVDADGS